MKTDAAVSGMNILIINTNRDAYPVPVLPSGACMIAEAAERAGHAVSLVDLMFTDDPDRTLKTALESTIFDVIGLSVRNIDNIDMRAPRYFISELIPLIDTIRRSSDAHIVLGGAALMVMPEEIMRATGVPCAVVGDGESVFPRLIERMARNEPWAELPGVASLVGGRYRANATVPGLSHSCSGPDYGRWLDMKAYCSHMATIPLQTKLGCRFQCVYCTYRKIEGHGYRLSEPSSVAEAVRRYASSGFKDIEFVDNVFNSPYDHAIEVCEAIISSKKHRARLQSIELSPVSFDQRLLCTMERAGFVGIGLTVESASGAVLHGLNKGFTAREVHAAAEVVRRNRLPCLWIFMMGGPGETRDTVRETLSFAEKFIRPQDAAFFNIGVRIYPRTELESIARSQGVLAPLADLLEPAFYVSPEVEADWIAGQVKLSMNSHMNFMDGDSMSFSYLPQISRLGHRMGLKPPLWRYTRLIRRGLRSVGMRV